MTVTRLQILDILKAVYPFRKLKPAQLEIVADHFGTAFFDQGQVVFEEGTAADTLFLVLGGSVQLLFRNIEYEENRPIWKLRIGDFFGFDMLEEGGRHSLQAEASSDLTVLTISREQFEDLCSQIPDLVESLLLLYDAHKLALSVNLPWRDKNEAVYFIGRRHPVLLFVRLLLPAFSGTIILSIVLLWLTSSKNVVVPIVVLGLTLVGLALWVLWDVVDWRNDFSIVTSERVVFQERIVMLYDSRHESPLNAILSITSETSLLGRWLSYGDVIVRTYAGLIVLPDLKHPELVEDFLNGEWFRSRSGIAREEKLEKLETVIGQRIGTREAPPPKVTGQVKADQNAHLNTLLNLLANMFQLRFEIGGAITYRTHWYILLTKIWIPTLLFLLLQIFLIARIARWTSIMSIGGALAFVGLCDLILGVWWGYKYLDWRNDYYMLTDDQVVDVNKKPLGHEQRRSAPLRNILSISFERLGIWGLILNFGTVRIKIGETELTFDNVYNPNEVQREIFKRMTEQDYKQTQDKIADEEHRLADWIEAYHRVRAVKPVQPVRNNLAEDDQNKGKIE